MKKYLSLILAIIILMCCSCSHTKGKQITYNPAAYVPKTTGPVTTEEQAISIAKDYVDAVYNDDFSEYTIEAAKQDEIFKSDDENNQDDVWIVAYGLGDYIAGGGGPEIHINAKTGEVISGLLQK